MPKRRHAPDDNDDGNARRQPRPAAVRPRRQREATALRPEAATAQLAATRGSAVGECQFYARPDEAERYTAVAKDTRVQHELSLECLGLLGLQQRPQRGAALVLDVGCGGGLSSDVVAEAGHFCVACDVNPQMLAQGGGGGGGGSAAGVGMFASDMRDGVAARAGVFDGAISVSALQWICSDREGLRRFFAGLHRSLRPGARACLQFYPTREHARLAVRAARGASFGCELVLSMPHATKARKHFLVLTKAEESSSSAAAAAAAAKEPQRCGCPLAWPIDGAVCKLAWSGGQRAAGGGGGGGADATGVDAACERLKKPHAEYIARLKRLLQRAQRQPHGHRQHAGRVSTAAASGKEKRRRGGGGEELVYSYQRRAIVEAAALMQQQQGKGKGKGKEQGGKNGHLAVAFKQLATLSPSELVAMIEDELRYATESHDTLPCFQVCTTTTTTTTNHTRNDTASGSSARSSSGSTATVAAAQGAAVQQGGGTCTCMRWCAVCATNVRVGEGEGEAAGEGSSSRQWEEHIKGKSHEFTLMKKKQALRQAIAMARTKHQASETAAPAR
jgi:18S rRNA (guanine1575-N7)-methyltransferase